jgi:hypothetical protein
MTSGWVRAAVTASAKNLPYRSGAHPRSSTNSSYSPAALTRWAKVRLGIDQPLIML